MNIPAIQMHRILITVKAKEIAPILRKSSLLSIALNAIKIAFVQHIPALTAGGRSDAEIATPTNEDVLFPKMLRATPIPLRAQTPITKLGSTQAYHVQ